MSMWWEERDGKLLVLADNQGKMGDLQVESGNGIQHSLNQMVVGTLTHLEGNHPPTFHQHMMLIGTIHHHLVDLLQVVKKMYKILTQDHCLEDSDQVSSKKYARLITAPSAALAGPVIGLSADELNGILTEEVEIVV